MNVDRIVVSGKWLKVASFDDEYIREITDPESILNEIKSSGIKADMLTFWQLVPDADPRFSYYYELEDQAILHIKSYEDWIKNHADRKARQAANRAVRRGISVKEVEYDDAFVSGITEVINETPIRQGRPYRYYGLDKKAVDKVFKRDLQKCILLAAFFEEEIVGFVKLGVGGSAAVPFGMISMTKHLDKCPQNLLLAEAVRTCEQRGVPYFWYGQWLESGLGKFKIHNGFSKFAVPRYFVPITLKGKLALKLNLHKGIKNLLPEKTRGFLVNLRKNYLQKRKV